MRTIRPSDEVQKEGPQWMDRPGRECVGTDRWGKDHWFLFAMVDERVVNWHGQMNWDDIQVSQRNWPMLWNARTHRTDPKDGADYGLRLKPDENGNTPILKGHCQVDVLMDLAGSGLVRLTMPVQSTTGESYLRPDGHALSSPTPRELLTGHVEWMLMPWVKLALTEEGWRASEALRRHKGGGGRFAEFEMPGEQKKSLVNSSVGCRPN